MPKSIGHQDIRTNTPYLRRIAS